MICGSNTVEQQKEQFLLNIAELKTARDSQAACKEVDTFNSVQWERKQRHKSELTTTLGFKTHLRRSKKVGLIRLQGGQKYNYKATTMPWIILSSVPFTSLII